MPKDTAYILHPNSDQMHIEEDLVHAVMGGKLALVGHIWRMDNNRTIKSVLFGKMEVTRK